MVAHGAGKFNNKEPNIEKVRHWLATLTSKADSLESRTNCVQLASMINYFNKKSPVTNIPTIEWNDWKDKIATVGLVDKV